MLHPGALQHQLQELDKGDDVSVRQAIRSLKDYEEKEWATAPLEVTRSLVVLLQRHLLNEGKPPFVRQDVVALLGKMGTHSKPAIPQLIGLLQEGNSDALREAAVTALGDIGCADERVRTALVALWLSLARHHNIQVRVALALCKLHIDAEGLLGCLTSALVSHYNASRRKSAAEALAWCNKKGVDVVPALLTAALNDKDDEVRQAAEAGLAQLHVSREKAFHLCSKQLNTSLYAEAALRHSGPLGVPALIEGLEADESTTREKAARTLGCLGEEAVQAAPALTLALQDKELDVRLAAAKSLWNITKQAQVVVPVLIDLLEETGVAASDASESRRMYLQTVIEALWRIGPPAEGAIPALVKMTRDTNRHISESAVSALSRIAPAGTNRAAKTLK